MGTPERRFVDLSHVITEGLTTYPGLPAPAFHTHLSREEAERVYAPGVTFQIGVVEICTNTGTYLDVPFHRYADGYDLSELELERIADVPAVCIDQRGQRSIDLASVDLSGLAGHAVLIHTGHAQHFGHDEYGHDHPFLTASAAEALVAAGVACVGVDSLNVDDTTDPQRPVHTTLLGAGIPIIEHLTNLDMLPTAGGAGGFRFTAVPPKLVGVGTFTVRAYAQI